jgi:hypothetical protein
LDYKKGKKKDCGWLIRQRPKFLTDLALSEEEGLWQVDKTKAQIFDGFGAF